MPQRTDLKKILIIGAGPIIIGQACEFDYSGSQACRALKQAGYEVVLVNSNPATIMTDPEMADQTYVEPITPEMVAAIIETERPCALLPTMGGQTALNTAYALYNNGTLEQYGVALIGANFKAIHTAEDREAFKQLVEGIGLEVLTSHTVHSVEEAMTKGQELGFPLIIRTGFTLGGSGGAVVYDESGLRRAAEKGIQESPVQQLLLEESALGWKEYEFELMRDSRDNVVIVCSVENVDPMGVHTGDSITVAPAQTLSDKEYHTLRNASIDIIRAVGVDAGGCNIQFAVHPQTGRVVVIEMNPRVSRSSALVSKATGIPIAKISAKLAVGLTLDEITNDITQTTPASFEPALDYVVTKIPRFSFEKFPGSLTDLSPQMKSVGEVMAIGRTFQESVQKALRSLEIGLDGFTFKPQADDPEVGDTEALKTLLKRPEERRIRWIYHALHQQMPVTELASITGWDPWFLENLREIVNTERAILAYHQDNPQGALPDALLEQAARQGFSASQIERLLPTVSQAVAQQLDRLRTQAVFNAVDTCAGEFEAFTPYYYSTTHSAENEAQSGDSQKQRVVIIGGGPNRIGQGIEFDYCCVHSAMALQGLGYEAIMVNSNPETVSTDYDISDRLYFEPLTADTVLNILNQEKPLGIIAQLGGQTPLKLAKPLEDAGYSLLGTSVDSIDLAEDRQRFGDLLARLNLRSPESGTARSVDEALAISRRIGYPLIARPSYILGGRAMQIFYSEARLIQYLNEVVHVEPDYPVLVERFLEDAMEVDVDAVSDGQDTLVAAILQHIEQAGVHSGDSACVWPAQTISAEMLEEIEQTTHRLAVALNIRGLLNIQFALKDGKLYVLEVNPRASRTVPFVCKATGIPLVQMATRLMLGESLTSVKQLMPVSQPQHVAVKVPVFPFNKFKGSDPKLGPEMKSTGEVMGIDSSFALAFAKAHLAANNKLPLSGSVFISVNDSDKAKTLPVAEHLHRLGFTLTATAGTASFFQQVGLPVQTLRKKHEGSPNVEELIKQGAISLIINTPVGEEARLDDSYIRKAALEFQVPLVTTIGGAKALAEGIESRQKGPFSVRSLQDYLRQPDPAIL
ncbi:carbamoyl-phosphate synthase large subunit [Vampirovibrio chlorellavorus]|uniref:carbamoyl-phosphate synthase large subunit n=1 Tax=Vampirovibrio chlorellavorus TaxID=758823 RepID=UPI0026EC6442|nr:carbamoyl-phosphate synthase large subunit [Vampirovibrio chlorellavorus]